MNGFITKESPRYTFCFFAISFYKIWFHSDGEGKGTIFFISLPIVKEKPADEHEGEGPVLH